MELEAGDVGALDSNDKDYELSTTIDPSYVIHLIRQLLPSSDDEIMEESQEPNGHPSSSILGDGDQLDEDGNMSGKRADDLREEAGCVLWDLAANESHAELMVDNYILDVLLGILQAPHSERMREICLGILGNMACHRGPGKAIVGRQGMLETVVQKLCLTDTQTLIETCRLLNVGLHGEECEQWTQVLNADDVLERIMWIAQNTLNDQLSEKSIELLLAMVDNRKETAPPLLPSLVRLELPKLIRDLVKCELNAITDGISTKGCAFSLCKHDFGNSVNNYSFRDAVLDLLLQVAEAISLADGFASLLSEDKDLISLVSQVIRLAGKDEVGPSAVSAMVLLANLLTENLALVNELCEDPALVEQLLALMPTVGNDPDARNALWSIVRRICKCILDFEMKDSELVAKLASGSSMLVSDLEEEFSQDDRGLQAKLAVIRDLLRIFKDWLVDNEDIILMVGEASKMLEETLVSKG